MMVRMMIQSSQSSSVSVELFHDGTPSYYDDDDDDGGELLYDDDK